MVKMLKNTLELYQRKGADFAYKRKRAALFMRPGTGKTITALKVVATARRRDNIQRLLIVCPKTIISVWEKQLEDHFNLPYQLCFKLEKLAITPGVLQILVLSYGSLNTRVKNLSNKFDFIIFDESHKLKSRTSQCSLAAYHLSKNVPFVLLLSGTPVGKDEIDLFSQFRVLNDQIFGNWKAFSSAYTIKTLFRVSNKKANHINEIAQYKINPKAKKSLLNIIKNHSYAVDKPTTLPEQWEEVYYTQLTGKAAKHYRDFEKNLTTTYKDIELTEDLAITNLVRLHQLCGGFMRIDDSDETYYVELEQDKLKCLLDILENYRKEEKIVIFVKYVQELEVIEKALKKAGRSVATLYGKTKDRSIWRTFQEQLEPAVLICQIQTGGVGIDLFSSCVAIFYSNSYSYIDYDQALNRIHRRGQEKNVLYIHILIKNSIDVDIYNSLKSKNETAKYILNSLILKKVK